jgi:mono/diheme cytochrome c family protein
MYRGVLQHKIGFTSYLREQVLARKLLQPLDRGRIYRVVADGRPLDARPRLSRERSINLVRLLDHPNGWWRDTAQRLLVERQDPSTVAPLRRLARSAPDPRTRLHALFTLEGLDQLDRRTLGAASADKDRYLRMAAQSLAEQDSKAIDALVRAMTENPTLRTRLAESSTGRELAILERVLAARTWLASTPERVDLLGRLAERIVQADRPARILRLLDLVAADGGPGPSGSSVASETSWRQAALLEGVRSAMTGRASSPPLPGRPEGWNKLALSSNPRVRDHAAALAPWVTGKDALPGAAAAPAAPLTVEEQTRFSQGKELYQTVCSPCHQPSGLGDVGKGPPLVDSPWVLGSPNRLALILLNGISGPVSVGHKVYTFNAEMPSLMVLSDD